MNTRYVEEVNGTIIGRYMITGQLTYQGRNQGQCFYAETEDELKTLAAARLAEIKTECGRAFIEIYPIQSPGWMMKIID